MPFFEDEGIKKLLIILGLGFLGLILINLLFLALYLYLEKTMRVSIDTQVPLNKNNIIEEEVKEHSSLVTEELKDD